MLWRTGLLVSAILGLPFLSRPARSESPAPVAPIALPRDGPAMVLPAGSGWDPAADPPGRLSGNRNFPTFIGWMSNPIQNIDPRSLTQIWPMFGSFWTSTSGPVPDANFQAAAPGINLAFSDRLSFVATQGGYAWAHINHLDSAGILGRLQRSGLITDAQRQTVLAELGRQGRLANPGREGLLPELERAGALRDRIRARILRNLNLAGLLSDSDHDRDGWLNLGGAVQYTLIADAEEQFLLTAGLRFSTPAGSYSIFQGRGPVYLAPYLTAGQEFGCYHVLATVGYQFPAADWNTTTQFFNANIHLDRQCFGWVYPLVEVNWTYHTRSSDVDLQTQRGFIDFGDFSSTGNIVTLAVGANLVLIHDRLEFGAVYTTPLATQRGFDFNGLLAKMILRF